MIANVLILMAVCVTAVLVAARKHPAWFVPLLCFVLLFTPEEVKFTMPGAIPDLTAQRFVILVLLAFYRRLPRLEPDENGDIEPLPYVRLMVLSVLSMGVSTLVSVNVAGSLNTVLSTVLEMYVLCGLLSRLMLTRTDVDRVGKTFVVATVLGCLMGLLYYYGGIEYRDLLPSLSHRFMQSVDAARGDRLRSVYPHAILMGGAIAMNLPFLILWLARTDSGRTKAWLWIALGVELLCMYRTMSRGPWMATGIMLPILFVFCRGAARRILVSLGALAALVLLLRPGVFQTLYDLFYYTFVPQSLVGSSFSYRSALLNLAFSTLGESLTRSLFGFGPGTFFDLQLVAEFKDRSYRFFSCDSSWIAFMFGSGYVGFATMAILLLRPLWDVFRLVLATEGEDRQNAAAILACLAGFYFMMTNVAIFDWAQPQYMPWILIAMFTALRRLSAAAPAPVESAGQDGDAEARD